MKINKIIIFVIIFLKICGNATSEEIDFNASQIKLKEDGNITYATDAELNLPLKNIKITSKNAEYIKSQEILTLKDNVNFYDLDNDTIIKANKVIYEIKKNLISTLGNTNMKVNSNYKLTSENIIYDRERQYISGKSEALIEDNENNYYKLKEKFPYLFCFFG